MHRCYSDITDRLGPPLWWDGNTAPRYIPFRPEETGVYDVAVALVEIACQDCRQRFLVANEFDRYGRVNGTFVPYQRPDPQHLGWGDPPNHGCVGDTMSSDTVRVVEFWEKGDRAKGWDWQRVPEMEIVIDGDL